MDKYKTSVLGQALKKVYRREITVRDSVNMAENEIREVFARRDEPVETDNDTGFYGDLIGACPLCGKDVVKGKFSYGCLGYKDGCTFKVNSYICKRNISISNARLLLSEGRTAEIQNFISKNGKPFSARLVLRDGKAEFDFTK